MISNNKYRFQTVRRWCFTLILLAAVLIGVSCQFEDGAIVGHNSVAATGQGDDFAVVFHNNSSYYILVKPDDDFLGLGSFHLSAGETRTAEPLDPQMDFSYDHADQIRCVTSGGSVTFSDK